jgi:hypothetical protein
MMAAGAQCPKAVEAQSTSHPSRVGLQLTSHCVLSPRGHIQPALRASLARRHHHCNV